MFIIAIFSPLFPILKVWDGEFFKKSHSKENGMRKSCASTLFLLFLIFNLTGCSSVGDKNASQSIIYSVAAVLSLFLLIGCCIVVRKRKIWFVLLFSSVLVVNVGYTFLAMSSCLSMALWANRLAYLGSVFLPLAMLMIILDVSGTTYPHWLHGILGALSIIIFLITASPGILPIYYKEVSFTVVNGVSKLIKVYGPLHSLYLFYLLGYFAAMVAVIIRAQIKKTIETTAHAVILAIAVFVNIGVWFIEQLVNVDFELLSVSYIITELFLLGIHLLLQEVEEEAAFAVFKDKNEAETVYIPNPPVLEEIPKNDSEKEFFEECLVSLTPTEKMIFDFHLSGIGTKEIMAELCITENTIKFHNKNIYRKFGVSSKKQLIELCGKYIR